MATLNFKLAPQKNKVGRYIIRLHIVAGSSNTAVNTNISVEKKSDWLEKQQKVRLNPKANEILSDMMRHYQDILLALEQSGKLKGMKAKEIAQYAKTHKAGDNNIDLLLSLYSYWNNIQNSRFAPNTREAYKYSLKTLKEYNESIGKRGDFAFDDITYSWLEGYIHWLRNKYSNSNTINTKIKHLKKVVNHCYEDGKIDARCRVLFQNKVLSKQYAVRREDNTEMTTLTRDNIVALLYKDYDSPYTNMARDMWLFSFFMVGMNATDLFDLKKENMVQTPNGWRCIYQRDKTGKTVNIPLCDIAIEIIKRYYTEESEYIFTFHKYYQTYQGWYRTVEDNVKRIAKDLNMCNYEKVTWYCARDSWATICANELDISAIIIDRALSHSTKSLAENHYIAKDKNDVDDACTMMLQYIKSAHGFHNANNGEILKGYSWRENVKRDRCPYTPYSQTKSISNPLF